MAVNNSTFTRNLILVIVAMIVIIILMIAIFTVLSLFKDEKNTLFSINSCYKKANYYYDKDYKDLAEDKLIQCLKDDPNNNSSILLLAEIYADQKKYSESDKLYEKYITLNPKDLDVAISLSNSYDERNEFKKGIDILKKTLPIAPKSIRINNNLCWMLAKNKQYEEADPYCKKAIGDSPGESYVIDSYAYNLAGLGQTDEAIRYYKEAISIDPNVELYYYHIADAYALKKDYPSAIENYNKFIKLSSSSKEINEAKEKIKLIQKQQSMLKTFGTITTKLNSALE